MDMTKTNVKNNLNIYTGVTSSQLLASFQITILVTH